MEGFVVPDASLQVISRFGASIEGCGHVPEILFCPPVPCQLGGLRFQQHVGLVGLDDGSSTVLGASATTAGWGLTAFLGEDYPYSAQHFPMQLQFAEVSVRAPRPPGAPADLPRQSRAFHTNPRRHS